MKPTFSRQNMLFIAGAVIIGLSLTFSTISVLKVLSAPLAALPPTVTVPNYIGYEGYVANPDGSPVATGTYTLTFKVYYTDTAVITDSLWSEVHPSIPITNGVYAVTLGEIEPLQADTFSGARWIGVTVAGQGGEITPRAKVASVPFALNANVALTALSAPWSGITDMPSVITGTGTAGYIPRFTGATAISNGIIRDNGAYVGVGVAPDASVWTLHTDALHVDSSIRAGNASTYADLSQTSGQSSLTSIGGSGVSVGLTAQNSSTFSSTTFSVDPINGATLSASNSGSANLAYAGNLGPVRNSTAYTGYVFVPLITPTVVFNAKTFSAVGTSTEITATTLGIPAYAKAIVVNVGGYDSGGVSKYFAVGPSATNFFAVQFVSQIVGITNVVSGICPTDANGSIWYRATASGTNTLVVTLRIWGYFI